MPRTTALTLLLSFCPVVALTLPACGETQRPDGGVGLLEVGSPAPDLRATAHDGTPIALRELGRPAVVYFYPADATPGCTTEACAFRDVWNEYQAAGVMVIGVSTQDLDSKHAFADEQQIPFPLIADTDESWAKAFGVSVTGGYAKRVSFLLDKSGKVAKVYPDVDPGVHARAVLDDAKVLP